LTLVLVRETAKPAGEVSNYDDSVMGSPIVAKSAQEGRVQAI
jgi:hypothetical protein